MKLVIAGSRDLELSTKDIDHIVEGSLFEPSTILNGACYSGVDKAALAWAVEQELPVSSFPADWKKSGKAAGPLRNREMAKRCDALIVIWDGTSKGSKNMLQEALKLKKPVYEVICKHGPKGRVIHRYNYPKDLEKQILDQFDPKLYHNRVRRRSDVRDERSVREIFHKLRGSGN